MPPHPYTACCNCMCGHLLFSYLEFTEMVNTLTILESLLLNLYQVAFPTYPRSSTQISFDNRLKNHVRITCCIFRWKHA